MRAVSHKSGESGVVLLTTLLILMMISALMVGFYAAVNSDVRATAIDRDQTQAYAAAHAGLEKLTSDLAQLFTADFSPSKDDILAFNEFPPTIPGFEYRAPGGAAGSGYAVAFSKTDVNGNPAPENTAGSNITAGAFKGLKGIITKYPITITARSITGNAEVRLRRELQTVAVPVFQFGVFSETDLTFYAGDNFDFGGRVHTNGNLFLSNLSGKTLTFTDYITAVKEVVRAHFSNGLSVSSNSFTGNVLIPTAIGSPGRNLKYTGPNEASVTTMPTYPLTGQTVNTNWFSIAHGTYKDIIRNYKNGAQRLDLPLVSQGATPIDLIRRPVEDEDVDNEAVYLQRFYSQASLRILLSDRSTDITTLPEVTGTPVALDNWIGGPPTGYTIDATHPPIARSPGPLAAVGTLASSSAVSGTSPNVTINLSTAVPVELRIPLLTVGALTNVVCTGKTASSFTGCTLSANVASGAAITATVTDGTYSWTASTVTTASASSGSGRTLTVTSNDTLDFTPKRTFWVNGTATAPTPPATVLVSCTGYTESGSTHQLAGCSWTGNAAPANSQTITMNTVVPLNTGLIGGFIKIDKQDDDGNWTDVTMEILNLGLAAANQQGAICSDPNPDAVLRIQRLRDNGGGSCDYSQSLNPYNYWPNVLYDTREGNYRNVATSGSGSGMNAGGVMAYVSLDVANLKKWLAGTTGTTGTEAWNQNGYIVYFSDRRGDHNEDAATADVETGEYGFEDVVTPASSTGTPDGNLQAGENINAANIPANTVLDRYGEDPTACCGVIPAGTTSPSPYDANSRPWTQFTAASTGNPGMAYVNKPVLFRRALKLVRGNIIDTTNTNMPTAGLTVASENPVYVQGNYNATTSNSAEPNVPAAILADAVSVLSNNWTDAMSFRYPNDAASRPATTTGYRFAVIAGKGLSFTWPSAGSPHFLFGTDGGVGNFLRLLEDWNISGVSINYRGSIVSLFHSRQATGTFKYGTNVYDYGDRNFNFDSDFLLPSLLPPGTPMFRDVNTLTFRQILRPTQ